MHLHNNYPIFPLNSLYPRESFLRFHGSVTSFPEEQKEINEKIHSRYNISIKKKTTSEEEEEWKIARKKKYEKGNRTELVRE